MSENNRLKNGLVMGPLISLGKSMSSSLTNQWYNENCLLRYVVGRKGFVTEQFPIIDCPLYMNFPYYIQHARWDLIVKGVHNFGSLVSLALVIRRKNDIGKGDIIELSMLTPTEKGPNFEKSERICDNPIYPLKDCVIFGKFVYLSDRKECEIQGGFKNSSYPGPIVLQPGDSLCLLVKASTNIVQPQKTDKNEKVFITGTLSWAYKMD